MKTQIAVLDDYQQVALTFADWTSIQEKADVSIFHDHLADVHALVGRLLPFNVLCVMRERTPLTKEILSQLPNLKMIVSTGTRNASIDVKAAEEFGIAVTNTGYVTTGAPELTWALLMAIARRVPEEVQNFKNGRWQTTVGTDLSGKTIGLLGLGRVGSTIARYARAFDMEVIAWSQNLTEEKANEAGARLVSKAELFSLSDFVSVHLVLSERSRGIVDASSLILMKPTAYLINTSRGPLVNEQDLLKVLTERKIAGAALDVFDIEPLSPEHPLRILDNVLATAHIGYVTEHTYRVFYQDTVRIIREYLSI